VKKVLFTIAVGVLPLVSTPAISQSLDQQFRNEQSAINTVNSLCVGRYQNAQYKYNPKRDPNGYSKSKRYFITKENEVLQIDYWQDLRFDENYKCETTTDNEGQCNGRYIIGKQLYGPVTVDSMPNPVTTCLLKKEGSEIVLYTKYHWERGVNRYVLYVPL